MKPTVTHFDASQAVSVPKVAPPHQRRVLDQISELSSQERELHALKLRVMNQAHKEHSCSLAQIAEADGSTRQNVHLRLRRHGKQKAQG